MSTSKLIAGIVIAVLCFAIPIFLPAGTLDWPRAWIFVAVVFVACTWSTAVVYRASPGLLRERFKPPVQKGQPLADKIVTSLLLVAFFGLMIFIRLDVSRFHLLPQPGPLASALGLVLFILGWVLMTFAMRENAFAAPVVKYQEERRQKVIDTGVYSRVRHPMYTGAVLLMIGMPLWLESYAAVIFALLPTAILVVRILVEERFLKRELAGYEDYTKRVRYRLIPFVW
ncbi:MAG TPA: isoprenylcysteine carboxylmethyltransferase family protein [Verrucomicrobiae bacterium]|jgi:protein-S-isoprenylcysteine O-methyltransferase Ste14|nr:isoprenylcysteine carboxylmethyltransferase family protein [Verrucomicrobiae bacterium]